MGENSKIEWTDDTVSLWWGCTRYGEGCRHCYAEKLSKRSGDFWGPQARRLRIKSAVAECERLNRKAEREGKPRLVFINSMSDFFEQHDGPVVDRQGQRLYNFEGGYKLFSPTANVGGIKATTLDDLRREAFETFACCQRLRFLLLTKRPENVLRMWPTVGFPDAGVPGTLGRRLHLANVWLGTSIATQADADRNIPLLLECRDLAPVLFLSCEPLLGPLDLTRWMPAGKANWQCQKCGSFQRDETYCLHCRADAAYLSGSHVANKRAPGTFTGWTNRQPIDWVIVGGESGHGARPCHPDWVRKIRDQCKAAGVPFLLKQWGEWAPYSAAGIANGWTRTRVEDGKAYGSLHAHDFSGDKYTETTLFNGKSFETRFIDPNYECLVKVGKANAGRLLDGVEYSQFPVAVTQ